MKKSNPCIKKYMYQYLKKRKKREQMFENDK